MDEVLVGLPKGAYKPTFECRTAGLSTLVSIAVVPFANLTKGGQYDSFSDGLTEEMIHHLTRIPDLSVLAWKPASHPQARRQNPTGIGQQLRVGFEVRGSVLRSADRIHVTVHLVDSHAGASLLAKAYDSKLEDTFAIQEEIALAAVNAVAIALNLHRDPGSASTRGDRRLIGCS